MSQMKKETKAFKSQIREAYMIALRLENLHHTDGYPEMDKYTKENVLYELKRAVKDLNKVIKRLENK
jgi:glucosamine 6-phosphate synthetase-like amidotransferase/phosphosugar isomerase protein